jgi:hypothetical protein
VRSREGKHARETHEKSWKINWHIGLRAGSDLGYLMRTEWFPSFPVATSLEFLLAPMSMTPKRL